MKKVKRDKAWMTDFNVERNYSSPFRVEELMEDWALTHSAVVQVRMAIIETIVIRVSHSANVFFFSVLLHRPRSAAGHTLQQ